MSSLIGAARTLALYITPAFTLAVALPLGLLTACGTAPNLESCDDVSRSTTRDGADASMSNTGSLVRRVIDGDTIEMADGARVRYIGVDTPERNEPFYLEATDYNRRLVEGQRVKLLKDESNKDRFGRLLRYVLAGDILVNAELVREGLAEAKSYEPDVKFAACFDTLMREAKENRRGMWGP